MKTRTTWILRAMIAMLSVANVIAEPDNLYRPERIAISVYDFARIGPKTLPKAERLATAIFANAGIDAGWTAGVLSDANNLMTDFSAVPQCQCATPLRSAILRVQILSHAPNGFSAHALGYALPFAKRGMQVTIYADRIEEVSGGTLAAFYRVLGYALAHELGHVLLRSSSHDESGLMKGVWTKSDWQRAAVGMIPFAPDQARRMAEGLHAAESRDAVPLHTSADLQTSNAAAMEYPH